MSKRILPDGSTTLHTPVSTQAYSAPEVLGLDSNSETSNYTNSVDIWSLGCVIYELLVGTKLFALEGQVSRYYFGKWLFPEDKLKGLSPPADDTVISLLKSMLVIQPDDHPTAAAALSHSWLAGIRSDNEDSDENQDEVTQSRNKSTRSGKRKNSLSTHDRPKKRRSRRNKTKPANIRCIPGGVALSADAGSQSGNDLRIQKSIINTSMMRPSLADADSVEYSRFETWRRKSESIPHNFQATDSKSPNALGKTKIHYIPQTCPQSSTPSSKLNLLTNVFHTQNWMLNLRAPASSPPAPDPYWGNSLQSTRESNGPTEHTRKKTHKVLTFTPTSTSNGTISRITHWQIHLTR